MVGWGTEAIKGKRRRKRKDAVLLVNASDQILTLPTTLRGFPAIDQVSIRPIADREQ